MSETTASLRRKIDSARELQSVVRTMKALAASNIGQYEQSVRALVDYDRTVELGLAACLRQEPHPGPMLPSPTAIEAGRVGAVVFGSDQGLVGRFNDVVVEQAAGTLAGVPGQALVWAVGERVQARLEDAGLPPAGTFAVPNSVRGIAATVGRVLLDCLDPGDGPGLRQLYLVFNRLSAAAIYQPVTQRLLPLDADWGRRLQALPWPTRNLPETLAGGEASLRALIGEYLFVSLFRACAESLASENASRRAAMERADKNIGELLETLHGSFHRLRQSGIDEELFDVISGFEAMAGTETGGMPGRQRH
jgi:F-type H+-transporting ATPase subunit gamma